MYGNRIIYVKIAGFLTFIIGLGMLPCFFAGVLFEEIQAAYSLLTVSLMCMLCGFVILKQLRFNKVHLRYHEGWLIACLGWLFCSIMGMLPFYFGGNDYPLVGCFFESVAGFTTTGCSVFDINFMPKCLLMWKAVESWLGGMGILVLVVSIFPALGITGQSIASVETTGPTIAKMDARFIVTGKFLYLVYMSFTLVEFLLLVAGPLDWYDALITSFSSISTSGLVITSENAALFTSTYVRLIVVIFTVLASLNFYTYYLIIRRKFKEAAGNVEIKVFFGIITFATILIAVCLKVSGTYSSLWQAIKDSLCQVVAFIATSGYYVCDYTRWPTFTVVVLFTLLFIGGCSMSTSGSLKIIRFVVLAKLVKRGLFKQVHPRAVMPIKVEGKPLPSETVSAITTHIILFFSTFLLGCIVISLNNFDMETTISTVIGIFSNTGVAMGEAGCSGYFGMFNGFSQFFLAVLMVMGRLEMYAVFLLFSRSFWKIDSANAI